MGLNPATDNRPYTGTGANQTRGETMLNQSGPVATNKQLFSGTLAGNVIASTDNPKPLVPYLSDGTIVVRGFVTRSANNLTTNGLGETVGNVNAQTGTLVDYNAGGGNAFDMGDLFAPVYGVDNQTCSKLTTDGTTADFIGMFMGIDVVTGNPIVLVDPVICALLANINAAGLVHKATVETITGEKIFTAVIDINAGLTASGAVANDFSGGTGTFLTSSGANTLSGHTTVAAAKNFAMAAGAGAFDLHLATGASETPTSTSNFWKWNQRQSAGATVNAIADVGTAQALPVTSSYYMPITTAAAETNTLAIPTFVGQTISLCMIVRAVGDRVITSAQILNQANNTIMTFGAVGDYIKLEAISYIAGALRWRVVANDGVALS